MPARGAGRIPAATQDLPRNWTRSLKTMKTHCFIQRCRQGRFPENGSMPALRPLPTLPALTVPLQIQCPSQRCIRTSSAWPSASASADFDAAALKDARPRELTQAIAAWIYENTDFDGVTFTSRHGDDLQLWAIFERPGDGLVSPKLQHRRSEDLHHDSDAIRHAFRMLGLNWKSE